MDASPVISALTCKGQTANITYRSLTSHKTTTIIVIVKNNFILKGDICWSRDPQNLNTAAGAFLICADGKSAGVFPGIPPEYSGFPLIDHTGSMIIPGLVDLHTHAPQFAGRIGPGFPGR